MAMTVEHLAKFHSAIQAHLLTKNVCLYIYPEHALTHRPLATS